MEELTPATLVAYVHERIASGAIPPLGEPVSIDDAIPLLAAGLEPVAGPDVESVMVGTADVANTFSGIEGIRAGWRDWGEAFRELTLTLEEVVEVPAGALVRARQVGAALHGGNPIEQRSAMLLRLRNGRVGVVEFYLDRVLAETAAATAAWP
jgi:ketosteroid isomerase-like protein